MSWNNDISENATFLFSKGFQVDESRDEGMGKIALLSFPEFAVRFICDKGPVHCDIKTKYGFIQLIYLANYLNGKVAVYDFPGFYWEGDLDSADKYIRYFDDIIETEFNKIQDFIERLTKAEFDEVDSYGREQNLKSQEQDRSHNKRTARPWISRFFRIRKW